MLRLPSRSTRTATLCPYPTLFRSDTSAVAEAAGGKVLGAVRHPLSTSDFSSFLLQAQASGAKVIGLANAGGDTIHSIKQAAEFGIVEIGRASRRVRVCPYG